MSGGYWDYISFKIEDIAKELNPEVTKEEREFGALLEEIAKLLHSAEWWKSGDTPKESFQKEWNGFKEKFLKEVVNE